MGTFIPFFASGFSPFQKERKKQFLCPSTKRKLTVRRDHTNNMEIKIKYLKSGD